MKLIHLSDLHLGKRVNEYSMLEDQKFIIAQILDIIKEEQRDAVLLAGDIYDKAVPSAEAVCLFDAFLTELSGMKHRIFMISGNHDSAERIAFGSRLLDKNEIYLSPVYDGNPVSVSLYDVYGEAVVYLLPFVKPVHVRSCFPEETVESYTEAMRVAVNHMEVDRNKRNILVTHQFVTGASRCDSEDISVGGTDNVDASVFEPFDYVALGHLHRPQTLGDTGRIRYCGSPLKYSFSEAAGDKSVTIVSMDDSNWDKLHWLAPTVEAETKIVRMTDYCRTHVIDHVPDPYYGGAQGFENVIEILEDACEGMLEEMILMHNS